MKRRTRRAPKDPVAKGGWSMFFTFGAGADCADVTGVLNGFATF